MHARKFTVCTSHDGIAIAIELIGRGAATAAIYDPRRSTQANDVIVIAMPRVHHHNASFTDVLDGATRIVARRERTCEANRAALLFSALPAEITPAHDRLHDEMRADTEERERDLDSICMGKRTHADETFTSRDHRMRMKTKGQLSSVQ